jgi:hypothetical protein
VKQTAATRESGQKDKNSAAASASHLATASQAFSITNPVLGAFHFPPVSTRDDILRLQSVTDNRAVSGLLEKQQVFLAAQENIAQPADAELDALST